MFKESKVTDLIMWCGKEFQSVIARGKKKNLYELILAYRWVDLLAVLLVKERESIRMWKCGISTRLLIILNSIIKVTWSCRFSKVSQSESSNSRNTGESCKIIKNKSGCLPLDHFDRMNVALSVRGPNSSSIFYDWSNIIIIILNNI